MLLSCFVLSLMSYLQKQWTKLNVDRYIILIFMFTSMDLGTFLNLGTFLDSITTLDFTFLNSRN